MTSISNGIQHKLRKKCARLNVDIFFLSNIFLLDASLTLVVIAQIKWALGVHVDPARADEPVGLLPVLVAVLVLRLPCPLEHVDGSVVRLAAHFQLRALVVHVLPRELLDHADGTFVCQLYLMVSFRIKYVQAR